MSRADTLVRRVMEARRESTEANALAREKKEAKEQAERELYAFLEDQGQKSGTYDLGDGYGRVRATRREQKKHRILDKARLLESIREMGLVEELMKDEPRAKQLNDFIKTRLESGEDLPEGLDFYVDESIQITRLK